MLQTVFVGFALYWTVKDWRADLVEMRRFLRMLVTAVFGINIVSETLLTRVVIPNDDILMLYVAAGLHGVRCWCCRPRSSCGSGVR